MVDILNHSCPQPNNIIYNNSLAIPKLLYVCNMLHPPESFLKEVKKNMIRFIWNSNTSKVKYNAILNSVKEGGLNVPDIYTKVKAQQVMWIKRLITPAGNGNAFQSWKILPNSYLKNVGGLSCIKSNFGLRKQLKDLPFFL